MYISEIYPLEHGLAPITEMVYDYPRQPVVNETVTSDPNLNRQAAKSDELRIAITQMIAQEKSKTAFQLKKELDEIDEILTIQA
jgi:hypothetical protein